MAKPLLGTVDEAGFIWTVPRQIFVKLYVATGDAKAAARDSKLPEDDDPAALLEIESVQDAITDLHEQVLRRVYETADTVIARYSNVAESNIFDFIETGDPGVNGNIVPGNVKIKDWRKMPRHMQQRVKKFKVTTPAGDGASTNFEIELHDSMKANDSLVRILKLDGDDAGDNAKSFAEQIHAFMQEVEQLDDNYDGPKDDEPS